MRIAIIGAGLAGTACAYVLKQAGLEPVIYEAGGQIAPGASGNALGLYNPRLSAERNAESDFYTAAFALALRTFNQLNSIEWNKCGALHLATDETREKRFRQAVKNWQWLESTMKFVDRVEATRLSGIDSKYDALYLPDSGTVSPKKLCEAYAKDVEVHFNSKVDDLSGLKADVVVLACGMGVKDFSDIPLQSVRGQITQVSVSPLSEKLKCNLCYGGYISPAVGGSHMVGATFQRWLTDSDLRDEDDQDNLLKLEKIVPITKGMKVIESRASLRTTSKDHFPVIGPLRDNIYVSTAHGSHGILSSLVGAQLLADMILERPYSLPKNTLQKLKPARFAEAGF